MKVSADVFPARIAIALPLSLTAEQEETFVPLGSSPDGTRKLDRCRIVVVDDQIIIAIDDPAGPRVVFQEKITSFIKQDKLFRVHTISGQIMVFIRDDSCGCGSRLRSWSPYGNMMEA